MKKILISLILPLMLVFSSCGEDCPVDIDERIIEKPKPCENRFPTEKFAEFNYIANNRGISTDNFDYGRHIENSNEMKEVLYASQFANLRNIEFTFLKNNNAIVINADQNDLLSTEYLGGYLVSQNDKYSPYVYRYRFSKDVMVEDVAFELIYSITYYFSPDIQNTLRMRVYDYYLSFLAAENDYNTNNPQRVTAIVNKYFIPNQSNTVFFKYDYYTCF
jgi:hypothetical protein